MTLTMLEDFEIGLTQGGMVNIETFNPLEIFYPKWEYAPFQRVATAASGFRIGKGFPMASWTFGKLPDSVRDALKAAYCPTGLTHSIFIKTPIYSDTKSYEFATFSGLLQWPEQENHLDGCVVEFTLMFTNLVLIT